MKTIRIEMAGWPGEVPHWEFQLAAAEMTGHLTWSIVDALSYDAVTRKHTHSALVRYETLVPELGSSAGNHLFELTLRLAKQVGTPTFIFDDGSVWKLYNVANFTDDFGG
jgi:hypothetical protein